MLIGAYSFKVTNNISENYSNIFNGVKAAKAENVRFTVFCECALTGYPPVQISIDKIDFDLTEQYLNKISELAFEYDMYIAVGTVIKENDLIYNAVVCFSPNGERQFYSKRALGGWDKENFTVGNKSGIFNIDGYKIGVRICYEIRFPEYFRELYDNADCTVVCFNDTKPGEDSERYEILKSHLRTRACENIMPVVSVNCCNKHQTAPTAVIDGNGCLVSELSKSSKGMLVYNLVESKSTFSSNERKDIIDKLKINEV